MNVSLCQNAHYQIPVDFADITFTMEVILSVFILQCCLFAGQLRDHLTDSNQIWGEVKSKNNFFIFGDQSRQNYEYRPNFTTIWGEKQQQQQSG